MELIGATSKVQNIQILDVQDLYMEAILSRAQFVDSLMSFCELPPEIHLSICEFAHQVGKTNLVHINKYFYELATPLLYRVVYLPTRSRVISFQYTLFNKPGLSAYVRHVLISDRNRDEFHVVLPDFIVYWPQTNSERILRRQRIRDWLVDRDKELLAFRTALRHILSLVSARLYSLTLLHYEHSIKMLHDLLTFPYLNLEELTIRGDYPPLPNDLNLPSLKRLHLAAGDMPNPWASFSALTDGCPSLTHVRITEPLSCILSGNILAQAFEVTFGLTEYDPDSLAMPVERCPDGRTYVAPAPRLPPSMVELRLQPYPPEMSAMGMPYPDHMEMMDRLQAVEKHADIFKVLPANNENYVLPYSFDVAQRHWVDRMAGGEGCWGKTS
ncbi:hypothetical protein EW145_g7249 [Phellinidium pouzarii]|uniref:Uncharacterized protein n=1 Tax=Phellinidium pouzarii TaxID=167371 RepID=A0A4S4KM10_9AGAM|nr:hypothetical protein EW145_g7249 [Phellinidium pouzarii]